MKSLDFCANNSRDLIFTPDNDVHSDLIDWVDHINKFPNISSANTVVVGGKDRMYNCISWSLGITDRWVWPGYNYESSIKSFHRLFKDQGFHICDGGTFLPGVEKVCLYTKENDPTHAARQFNHDLWTSKLGSEELVIHDGLMPVSGPFYGLPTLFFARQSRPSVV
jgi:hypothetical protein